VLWFRDVWNEASDTIISNDASFHYKSRSRAGFRKTSDYGTLIANDLSAEVLSGLAPLDRVKLKQAVNTDEI
jgi:hypothetical protein